MRNRNAVRHAAQNFVIAVTVMILAGCGQNPGGNYGTATPIQPAMADTPGSSLDLQIPLDTAVIASNPQRFAVRGKYIAIDPGSTGQANLRINSISDTPRLAYPGSQFSPGDYTDLYFDYQAQPGKFLHVLYGDSPDILSSGNKVTVDPSLNSSVYINSNIFGAPGASAIVIVPAAQNVRGVKILGGTLNTFGISTAAPTLTVFSRLRFNMGGGILPIFAKSSVSIVTASTQMTDFSVIPQFVVPPGVEIAWLFSAIGNVGGDQEDICLNYQIL